MHIKPYSLSLSQRLLAYWNTAEYSKAFLGDKNANEERKIFITRCIISVSRYFYTVFADIAEVW